MKTARVVAAAALVLGMGSAASAEGWTVTHFDPMASTEVCMNFSDTMFRTYQTRFGGAGDIGRGSWTIGAYDLRGEDMDALFICADEAGVIVPFLVLHNSDEDNDGREMIADRLGDIWDEIVAGGGTPAPAPRGTK